MEKKNEEESHIEGAIFVAHVVAGLAVLLLGSLGVLTLYLLQ